MKNNIVEKKNKFQYVLMVLFVNMTGHEFDIKDAASFISAEKFNLETYFVNRSTS